MTFHNGKHFKWIGVGNYAFYCRDVTHTPMFGYEYNRGFTIGVWYFGYEKYK